MENWYWKYDSAVNADQCAEIIKMGDGQWRSGKVDTENGNAEVGPGRSSDVVFVNDRSVYELLEQFVLDANDNAGWRYELTAAQPIQLARYKVNEFYDHHLDSIGSHFDPRPRKLSLCVALNDDYDGGKFDFTSPSGLAEEEIATGTVIVFPSFLFHHVSPVTRGVRYSLVGWYTGPPFK